MPYENLLVETIGPALRITVNRPKALNALNRATITEMDTALAAVPRDTRVVVITGAGEKAFIAGGDISEMVRFTPSDAADFSRLGHALLARLEAMDAVVIAEVNGFALGGGCEVLLACDFAIASENARIGQPEVGLGVTPGFGGTTRLSRRIGPAAAAQLLYTGDQVTAAEAKALGLVNDVVPAAQLRARVDAIAARITKNAPVAVALTKRSLKVGFETDLASANALEREIFARCFATTDQREGMLAFLEKRRPTWKGA